MPKELKNMSISARIKARQAKPKPPKKSNLSLKGASQMVQRKIAAVEKNSVHSFTLILAGVDSLDALEASLYNTGCDDTLVGMRNGIPYVAFDREAGSLSDAIQSAMKDVKKIGNNVSVVRIEPDDVVSMSEIASRIKQSRESIRKYVNSERLSHFPPPISGVTGSSMRWRWSDVAYWLAEKGQIDKAPAEQALVVSRLNAALELQRMTKSKAELRKVLQLVE